MIASNLAGMLFVIVMILITMPDIEITVHIGNIIKSLKLLYGKRGIT